MTFSVALSWWVLLVAIAVFCLMLYFDYKSRQSGGRVLRIIALAFALLALLGLYLGPKFERDAPDLNVAIETSGAGQDVLDSLGKVGFKTVKDVETFGELDENSNIENLIIVGDGLERWELAKVNSPFKFIASDLDQEGLFELEVEGGVVQSPMEISFGLIANDSIQLSLSGPGIDASVKDVDPNYSNITFSVVPTLAGYLAFQVDGIRASDTIFSELVPVKVKERDKISVLMLAIAPSFEHRFLKNYLAKEGFGVAERIQVSERVFRDSFTNLKRQSLNSITSSRLEEFQLLVLDATSYNGLRLREQQAIKKKLRAGELGLIWTSNGASNDLVETNDGGEGTIEITDEDDSWGLNVTTERLSARSETIKFGGEMIGEVQGVGLGNVVFPLATNSYSLVLKGQESIYSQLWQKLLEPAIGTDWKTDKVLTPPFPRVGEPMTISVTDFGDDEKLIVDDVRLAPKEKWYRQDTWSATFWPKKRGWVSIEGTSAKFFVFDSSDWKNQKIVSKKLSNQAFAKSIEEGTRTVKKVDQPISKWVFFMVFLVSAGFLWLEQRIA